MGRTIITKRPETGEIVFERTFAARPETLWRCWTTDDVARWWGPRSWTAVIHEMDVRPGGYWRYTLVPDDPDAGRPSHCLAHYRRVDEPRTLTFLDGFADDEGTVVPGSQSPTAIELVEVDGGTHPTITITHPDAAALARAVDLGMVEGLSDALDRLEEHIHPQ